MKGKPFRAEEPDMENLDMNGNRAYKMEKERKKVWAILQRQD